MMEQNIFTKPFEELTADELLHLMDMIHSRIERTTKYYEKSLQFTYGSEYVFQMPEDDEV